MAVPKKKTSHRRSRLRRTHDSLTAVVYAACPNCGQSVLPHRVCTTCGFYKGKKVLEIESVMDKKLKKESKKKEEE